MCHDPLRHAARSGRACRRYLGSGRGFAASSRTVSFKRVSSSLLSYIISRVTMPSYAIKSISSRSSSW